MTQRRPSTRQDALSFLRRAHAAIDKAEARRDELVAACRAAGVTWPQIADAVGQAQPNATRKFLPRLAEHPGPFDVQDPLSALRQAHRAIGVAEDVEVEAVAACRDLKVTWQAIAEVVGQAQPNAVVKYGPKLQVTVRPQPD